MTGKSSMSRRRLNSQALLVEKIAQKVPKQL